VKLNLSLRIFAAALMAVAVFFLTFDHYYLQLNRDAEKTKVIKQIKFEQSQLEGVLAVSKEKIDQLITDAVFKIEEAYFAEKSALITYSLVGLGAGLVYALWLAQKLNK
jgi:hypothetical protein